MFTGNENITQKQNICPSNLPVSSGYHIIYKTYQHFYNSHSLCSILHYYTNNIWLRVKIMSL